MAARDAGPQEESEAVRVARRKMMAKTSTEIGQEHLEGVLLKG
jgi:hypothetical protein